jgi:hypothetical protein
MDYVPVYVFLHTNLINVRENGLLFACFMLLLILAVKLAAVISRMLQKLRFIQ